MKLLQTNFQDKRGIGDTIARSVYTDHYSWGKAYIDNDGNAQAIMYGITCKDYVVDTYFKETNGFYEADITKAQREQNCTYILLPNKNLYPNLLKNLESFLHPYEKQHGFTKTQVDVCEESPFGRMFPTVIIVRGSKKWMSTATAFSMYLSLIRMCICEKNVKEITFSGEVIVNYNEQTYFRTWLENQKQKDLLISYFNNPRRFMEKPPEKYNKTGFLDNIKVGHGMTGLFNFFQMIRYYKNNPHSNYGVVFQKNYFGSAIWKDVFGEDFKEIKRNANEW